MKNIVVLAIFLMSLVPLRAFSDNAPQADDSPQAAEKEDDDPIDNNAAKPDAPPPVDRSAQQQAGAPSAQAQAAPQSHGDDRDEAIFNRLKSMVKRLDASNRKGVDFPSKAIEAAIRTEFLRRADGDTKIGWLRRKNLRDADKAVAMDNLELLMGYSERLLNLRGKRGKAKLKPGEILDMKLMAAKGVIDQYNKWSHKGRGIASLGEHPAGLGANGKTEAARRKRLVASMVGGDDYSPIEVKKLDDYGKKYKASLTASTKEYEKLADLINKSANGSGGKKKKHKG